MKRNAERHWWSSEWNKLTESQDALLRKRDGLIFVINDPEVLKSGTSDSSYAVFGELKLEDPNQNMVRDQVKNFQKDDKPAEAKADDKKEDDKKEEVDDSNEEPLPEEGLTADHIDMVM